MNLATVRSNREFRRSHAIGTPPPPPKMTSVDEDELDDEAAACGMGSGASRRSCERSHGFGGSADVRYGSYQPQGSQDEASTHTGAAEEGA